MKPIIEVSQLSKKYTIGQKQEYYTLRDVVSNPFKSLKDKKEEFWALKDVSFTVNKGEVLGVIGPNGAGKSTLLKILSRITPPTEGKVVMRGRVASLLEVGTGFHQELTGRENIYLNGSILGMAKKEIDQKFDEIVKFADIGKFLDTPIKHYSSGMKVKLAFSVAAHLEPEILLIDEVLAVGDANFQKKSLGKMNEITRDQGRTIIFVSHNMAAIKSLCDQVIFIRNGKLVIKGGATQVLSKYINSGPRSVGLKRINDQIRKLTSDEHFKLSEIDIRQNRVSTTTLENGRDFTINIKYKILKKIQDLRLYFDILNENHEIVFRSFHNDGYGKKALFEAGDYSSAITLPSNFFSPARYFLFINASIYNKRACLPKGIMIPISFQKTGRVCMSYPDDKIRGIISPLIKWNNTRK